jgi:hypothetical protein
MGFFQIFPYIRFFGRADIEQTAIGTYQRILENRSGRTLPKNILTVKEEDGAIKWRRIRHPILHSNINLISISDLNRPVEVPVLPLSFGCGGPAGL